MWRMSKPTANEVTGYRNDGVGTAVSLVNAITVDVEQGGADGLAELLAGFNFDAAALSMEEAEELRDWARRLREIFTSDDQMSAVSHVNELMAGTPMRPHISDHGLGAHLHYAEPGAALVDRVRANTAIALAFLLCEYGSGRLGVCSADGCHRVYADVSRGPRRRFCSKPCLNRSTVAAYRARRTSSSG